MSASTSASSSSGSRFYGHEVVATTAARYITHLFACPNSPPPTAAHPSGGPPLANFIAYALYRTQLPPAVTSSALVLLSRLKAKYPAAKGSSGHRLFLASFMNASKMLCDDTYSNKSWVIVGQALFPLKEVNQMEREMLNYLDWKVNAQQDEITSLEFLLESQFTIAPSHHLSHPSLAVLHPSAFPAAVPSSTVSSYPQHTIAPSPTNAAASYPSPPCSPCASPSSHQHPPRERYPSIASASSTPSSSSSSPSACDTPPPITTAGAMAGAGAVKSTAAAAPWLDHITVVQPHSHGHHHAHYDEDVDLTVTA